MGGGDYSAVLEHAKVENPDSFTWVGYAADALPILEQAKAINFAPPFFVGAPPGWPPDFGESPLSEGVIAYEVWAEALTEVSDVSKDYYESYVEMYGSGPDNYLSALVYTAVHIFADGVERAGTLETDAVIAALEETEYVAPTMELITFSPSMIIQHQAPLTPMIAQYQGGELEVIYPWDRATTELIYPFPSWEGR
jgi:branched-chain amino acid transport system substrate-binding protein